MSDGESVNILLVAADPACLADHEESLRGRGPTSSGRPRSRDALQWLKKETLAAILVDATTPQADGLATAELIHRQHRLEPAAMILVTGPHVTDLDRLAGSR